MMLRITVAVLLLAMWLHTDRLIFCIRPLGYKAHSRSLTDLLGVPSIVEKNGSYFLESNKVTYNISIFESSM